MSGVNPGFGYWWLQTTNGFELWVRPPAERSAFWGVFGVIAVVWFAYWGLWEVLKTERTTLRVGDSCDRQSELSSERTGGARGRLAE